MILHQMVFGNFYTQASLLNISKESSRVSLSLSPPTAMSWENVESGFSSNTDGLSYSTT